MRVSILRIAAAVLIAGVASFGSRDARAITQGPTTVTTAGPLSVTHPVSVTANAPFSITVTVKDAFGNTINCADRIYVSINRLGSQSLLATAGTVTFNNLRASTVPVSLVVTDPQRSLMRTVTVAATAATPPTFTSASSVSFDQGTPQSFTVTTTGTVPVSLSVPPGTRLPAGVTFVNNADGTATLSGTPASGSAGPYSFTITASNVGGTTNQVFTLTVSSPGGTLGVAGRLLIVEALDEDLSQLRNDLLALGFTAVDTFPASSGTPSVALMSTYDTVATMSNFGYQDPTALGDNLATYFDNGGRVVTCFASFTVFGTQDIRGRWIAEGYNLIQTTLGYSGGADLLVIDQPGHVLLTGVPAFSGTSEYHNVPTVLVNGGAAVGHWNTGGAFIVAGVTHGRNRCDLNFWPNGRVTVSSTWSSNAAGVAIFANACRYGP